MPEEAFDTWLVQDAHFVTDLLWFHARSLALGQVAAQVEVAEVGELVTKVVADPLPDVVQGRTDVLDGRGRSHGESGQPIGAEDEERTRARTTISSQPIESNMRAASEPFPVTPPMATTSKATASATAAILAAAGRRRSRPRRPS